MREILFRGFHECENGKQKVFINGEWHKGEWVEGGYHKHTKRQICPVGGALTNDDICHLIIQSGFADWNMPKPLQAFDVLPETVGQYTGLTDKNGTKIFEGDIIAYADYYEYQCYLESFEHPEDFTDRDFSKMWTIDKVVYGDKVGYPAFDLNSHDFESNGLSELSESGQFYYRIISNIHGNPELLNNTKGVKNMSIPNGKKTTCERCDYCQYPRTPDDNNGHCKCKAMKRKTIDVYVGGGEAPKWCPLNAKTNEQKPTARDYLKEIYYGDFPFMVVPVHSIKDEPLILQLNELTEDELREIELACKALREHM